ncbi:MAG TPA: hypothetical protein VF138_12430 [Caulobacteraceae bacterium]
MTSYLLLNRFRELFEGNVYLHRNSSLGDSVAQHVPEDLVRLGRSQKLVDRAAAGTRVLNTQNTRRGIVARRGDGSFGEIIPGTEPIFDPGFKVARGHVATIEIGVEVKILAKAMIKQIDRVKSDLLKQVEHFQRGGDRPITVAVVGINYADEYCSFEGDRAWPTDGKKYKHPIQEAAEAEHRIRRDIAPHYDELLILRFKATNAGAYPFEWVNTRDTELDYAAILTRVSRQYEQRFG